mgnify:CR=1 FL=1
MKKLPAEQPVQQTQELDPDMKAWSSKNPWFMSTVPEHQEMSSYALTIDQRLRNQGILPENDAQKYYAEVDKRIRVDFPHKFGKTDTKRSTEPVQTVASASRSVKPGRKTVKLTSSQVAIANKLGVPLEEYAKQLKNTGGA